MEGVQGAPRRLLEPGTQPHLADADPENVATVSRNRGVHPCLLVTFCAIDQRALPVKQLEKGKLQEVRGWFSIIQSGEIQLITSVGPTV